jgi:N-acetylglucosaminyldiphosphoundecaprenol N-acetyl-beta-D-mannosaminyltransferase
MVIFGVFAVAAALFCLSIRLPMLRERRVGGLRMEGVSFVASVLIAAALGLLLIHNHPLAGINAMAGGKVLLLVAGLFGLLAIHGSKRLPPWLADVFVVIAAISAIRLADQPAIEGLRLPLNSQYISLGTWAVPFTVLWVWAISRMSASLNRTPHVTGGYLGIVSLTLLLAYQFSPVQSVRQPNAALPLLGAAALAGVGLISVPVALKLPRFNIGWSASLAMGFLLAQVAVVGLFKNLAFAILALMLLVFGLPVLDVSFYRLRAAKRGQNVTWEERRLRLHEVLMKRGLSRGKISLLYLLVAGWLCGLGVLVVISSGISLFLRIPILAILFGLGFVTFFSVTRVLMRRAENEEVPESIEAFGVRISAVTMIEAIDKIENFIQSKQPHHVVTTDANAMLQAQADPEYAHIIQNAALATPDGYGVIWGARLLNLPIYERVTGVDMVTGICDRAAKNGYSIYILGSEPGVAATAAKNLADKYPGMRVAGTHHGFWRRTFKEDGLTTEEADARMADIIREAKPDVLFVAMGIPLQEKFIAAQLQRMQVPVALGVGGSFDVYAGKYKRAPEAIQRIGMEWIYRVWIDPSRWKRMGYVPRFMIFALRTWIFGDKNPPNAPKTNGAPSGA